VLVCDAGAMTLGADEAAVATRPLGDSRHSLGRARGKLRQVELPRIRYTTTQDGLSIAYYVTGHGEQNTVLLTGATSHLEVNWEIPGMRAGVVRLTELGRLAVFDKRGMGLSDRHSGVGTLELRMEDLRAVMDAADFERANLVAVSESGAMAILFAVTFPERVERLVLVAAFPYGGGKDNKAVPLVNATWGTGMFARACLGNAPKDPRVTERLERNVATPHGINELMRQNALIDVRPILGHVNVPTLVVNDRLDPIVPVAAGRYLASHIPGARFVEVANGCHWGWGEHDNDEILDEIVGFLGGETHFEPDVTSDRVLATVLFTDIAGSTERAVRLGDFEWRQILSRYEAAARDAVSARGGRWVRFTGDGFVATFDGPGRCLACAHVTRQSASDLGLETRTGVHVGEIEIRNDDISGQAVHLAARVMSAARPNEIWVSSAIPGLVAGSGLTFESRGQHELKGFPEPVELYAVVQEDERTVTGSRQPGATRPTEL
jgi:class 3 adenylate cyclase/pimeloyl-ACP methyl ester carboxylesterase